jgi:hypothetical protein
MKRFAVDEVKYRRIMNYEMNDHRIENLFFRELE